MAILRQCLRELRVRRGEWDPCDADWADPPARAADRPGTLTTVRRNDLSFGIGPLLHAANNRPEPRWAA